MSSADLLGREHAEGEVELATLDQAQQLNVARRLPQLDRDVGPAGLEARQELRQDADAHALVAAEP
jgi:hypothetical protein